MGCMGLTKTWKIIIDGLKHNSCVDDIAAIKCYELLVSSSFCFHYHLYLNHLFNQTYQYSDTHAVVSTWMLSEFASCVVSPGVNHLLFKGVLI